MGNKSPLLISTLMAVLGTLCLHSVPTFAEATPDEGRELWSITEAKAIYEEVENIKDVTCGSDIDCRRNLIYDLMEETPKYAIAETYQMTSFMITAVNPAENTLRAYFRDLDFMAMEMDGEEIHLPLTELYILWLDSSYDNYGISYITAMRGDFLVTGMHPIYKATSELNGENWFPVEEEFEIYAPEANLSENKSGRIDFYARFYPSSVLGGNNYSTCVESANYEPGMECRVMFKEDGSYVFVPFAIKNDAPESEIPLNSDNEQTPSDNNDFDNTTGIIAEADAGLSSEISPKISAPNTGAQTNVENHDNDNFDTEKLPWWLGILIFLNSLPIIWLLWPTHRTKSQKTRKNTKKSLDKSIRLR